MTALQTAEATHDIVVFYLSLKNLIERAQYKFYSH